MALHHHHEVVLLLGAPGAGKGTQARFLAEMLGVPHVASGDLLREHRQRGTPLGRAAQEYMDRGDLVPDEVIVEMVGDAVADADGVRVLFDGFPRTVAQAGALADLLGGHRRELTAAVLIDVPDDVVIERILSRGQGRSDDNPETVRERLRVYHDETEPLVAYYEQRGLLRRVDGSGDPDAVYEQVRRSAQER